MPSAESTIFLTLPSWWARGIVAAAAERFRCIPFEELTKEDLIRRDPKASLANPELRAKTVRGKLGEVDEKGLRFMRGDE